jgi:hypothetical protein
MEISWSKNVLIQLNIVTLQIALHANQESHLIYNPQNVKLAMVLLIPILESAFLRLLC